MTNTKKQTKITKLFRRGALVPTRMPEDCDELQEEVQQLEQELKQHQDELYQLHQNSCWRKMPLPKKKKSELFVRPEKIVLQNSVETLKKNMELMSILSGIEVQSYEADDHCCIVYHLQHHSEHEVKHGLRIDMKNGVNEVSKSSLPLGFNLAAVLSGFDNVMLPECLVGVRKALVAYYDRLEQFDKLKKLLNIEAKLFKILDGSHIEITFAVRSEHQEGDEQIGVTLLLDYRVYDIRPKHYNFVEIDMPEGLKEALMNQCLVFKKKSLHKAFKEAFIRGNGAYIMVQEVGTQQVVRPRNKPKRFRTVNHYTNNDDTFHPEDCLDSDDDDDDDDDHCNWR